MFAGKAKVKPADTLLLPYQTRWIRDYARIKLMEKSRQIGMSWAGAYGLVRRKARKGERYDAWASSTDEAQAKLFLEDCKTFTGLIDEPAQDMGEQIIDAKEKVSAFVLRFANGIRINSMSSNPNAQAGKRGCRFLDEFALHRDPRFLYSIAYPGITWGGQLEIVSTHRGSGNFFNELVREIKEKGNPKGISLHTVTLQDALEQGFLYKLQEKLPVDDPRQDMDEADYYDFIRAGTADEESFQQEYCCVPADDASAFLPYDLIASCEYQEREDWELELKDCQNLYIGVDIGRRHDLTVIWVNEVAGGRHLTRRVICLRNTKFSEQEKVLYPLLALPNMRRCCIDNTGLGMQMAERAQDMHGKYRVEPVTFTPAVKSELAYPLRAAFEDGNVRIPFEQEIRADLRAIRKETTAAGNIRFAADRSEAGHADRFWALALALHAVGRDTGPTMILPAASGAGAGLPGFGDGYRRPDHSGDYMTQEVI